MDRATSVFVVSLDFELEWGVRGTHRLEQHRASLCGERAAVSAILEHFVRRDIHATWATVGFLFCANRAELETYLPTHRPHYADRMLDPYAALPLEVGEDEAQDPFHFAASLVKKIGDTPGQELGSHTFSHYYCLEAGQDVRAFRADLAAAKQIARKYGITLTSLVFPRNQVREDYLGACRDAGFSAYRGNQRSYLYEARPGLAETQFRRLCRLVDAYLPLTGDNVHPLSQSQGGVCDIPASRFLRRYSKRLGIFEPLRLRRILCGLDAAAKNGGVYHLWWHPNNFGTHLSENLAFLETILSHVEKLRRTHGMRSLNMGEVANAIAG
jgi:hypothetical protein